MEPTGNDQTWAVHAVGTVTSTRKEAIDDNWGSVQASITMIEPYGPDSLLGLSEFSHVEVLYVFDRVDPATVNRGARVPRNNPAWPSVGIFAQRAKNRPNRLGLVTCELVSVEGTTIVVRGLDAIDGTPIVDIKPCMIEFSARGQIRQPEWSHKLMMDYY